MSKPRKVKAKISRTVTEIAIVLLDKNGDIEEVVSVLDELDSDDMEILDLRDVISVHS